MLDVDDMAEMDVDDEPHLRIRWQFKRMHAAPRAGRMILTDTRTGSGVLQPRSPQCLRLRGCRSPRRGLEALAVAACELFEVLSSWAVRIVVLWLLQACCWRKVSGACQALLSAILPLLTNALPRDQNEARHVKAAL